MVKYLKQLKTRERATQRPVLGLRYLKALKARQKGLFLGILTIVVLVVAPFSFVYASTLFDDNFDSYENGNLAPQGGWIKTDGADWQVQSAIKQGTKAIQGCVTACGVAKSGNQVATGSIGFYIYVGDECQTTFIYFYGNPNGGIDSYRERIQWSVVGEDCNLYLWGEVVGTIDTYNEFFPMDIEWRDDTHDFRIKWEDKDWSSWYVSLVSWTYIDKVRFRGSDSLFVDSIGEKATPPPARVFGVSPASETTITDLDTNFTFGWEALDDWDSLSVTFQNRDTGIFSNAKILETVSPSGQETLTFENFNFDRNGKYYFYAVATRYEIEVIEGMYVTGRYSYQWSDDLVSPAYWFLIDIEGLTPFFEMTGFEEWYGEVSKFATPTDMFVSIAGFFQPTFNKIGEFGNRIKDYFNLSEVYSQGYEIGKTIAYFNYFVAQISLFLGGFPILKWVFIIILLLVGIFIFRLVLKFIPFLGGS